MNVIPLSHKEALYFRDQFKQARAAAFADAEAFQEIVFVIERLGSYLTGKILSLRKYKDAVHSVAAMSRLADEIPEKHHTWHSGFATLYDLVREARNDAFHQGAFVRFVTSSAICLALILEDALMNDATTIGDFMVRDPICASEWQPMSFIRQQMLKNSFTYLPILFPNGTESRWRLVSDYHIASYLRGDDGKSRNIRLAKTLESAVKEGLELEPAHVCHADDTISHALKLSSSKPILVVDKSNAERLVGIVTPFDLL